MEIIKSGNLEEVTHGKKYKAVCPRCGCEFVFTERECSCDQREGGFYIGCPTCGMYVDIPSRHVERIEQTPPSTKKATLPQPFQPQFQVGETVYMKYDPMVKGVVEDVPKEPGSHYYVRNEGAQYTDRCDECELLDVRNAFVRRLRMLLEEFKATIYSGWTNDNPQSYLRSYYLTASVNGSDPFDLGGASDGLGRDLNATNIVKEIDD